MMQMDYQTTMMTCASYAKGFEEIERRLQYWCVDKKPYRTVMHQLCKLDGNSDCEYPPLWFTHQAQTYAFASVLCDPEELRLWKKAQKDLSSNVQEMVAFWESDPPIWCYFTILEVLQQDCFLISDRLTGASLYLYSPSLSLTLLANPERKAKHFIALVAPNGVCHQSFGIIHSNNLGASDLDFFITMLDQQTYMTKGFSAVVNNNYQSFLGIDEVTYVPSMVHGGTWLKSTFNHIRIENFSMEPKEGIWETETKGNIIRETLTGAGETLQGIVPDAAFWTDLPFSRPSFYIDRRSGEGWITTQGRQAYDPFITITRHLYPAIPFGKVIVPDYTVSPGMLYLVKSQKRKAPWMDMVGLFPQTSMTAEAKENERLIATHTRSLGTSSVFAHGLSTVKDSVGLTMGRGPVRIGKRLQSAFDKSMLFTIDHQEPAFKQFVKAWDKAFPNASIELLNLFFQLLWYHSGCYKPVGSYASELQKQLPSLVKSYTNWEDSFSSFVLMTMKTDGFIMTETAQSDRIRPSRLFAQMVKCK
jgi:hypothetical protein